MPAAENQPGMGGSRLFARYGSQALLALSLTIAGCATASTGGTPLTAKDLLLDKGPAKFKLTLDTRLGVADAAPLLATDPTETRNQLGAFGYSDGAERVWTKADEDLAAMVFEFSSNQGPGNTLAYVRSQLKTRQAVTLFNDGGEPSGQGFDLSGSSRVGNRQVFCQGSLFPVDRYLFLVEDCAGGPRYSAGPLAQARSQYERAARLLNLPVASPSPVAGG